MRIREGDPLEIYTSNDGEVIFKKYSPINELSEGASQAAEVISKLGGAPVLIFDRDHVVACAGAMKKEFIERRLSPALEELLEHRKAFVYNGEATLFPIEGISRAALAAAPIISSGDITGAVVFLAPDSSSRGTDLHLTLVQAAAMFLGKQIED